MKKQSSLALILLLSLVVNTPGQNPPPRSNTPSPQQDKSTEDDVVRITTNLVQVDVTVTDKKGQPVTDLRPEEVEIQEDDRPQQITNFSYVSLENSGCKPTVRGHSDQRQGRAVCAAASLAARTGAPHRRARRR